MKRSAEGLSKIIPRVDLLATSSFTRAVQTAEILSRYYPNAHMIETESLKPEEKPESFLAWLKSYKSQRTVAIIGHEPHLSELCSYLVGGTTRPLLHLKKGGVCVIDFYDKVDKGRGIFVYLMEPVVLEKIAS